ncbi:glycine cleavage T C-terminal barrel domain-containing protein [Saccharopolyspora rectivirgula]|jgi:glycine cleavage system aminomethyltransferase T|uniref:Glycine cleavage system protein T n=1 Tax=Saccharopolyspora rectivirgula TaxID=28042 RepID=A0A073AXP0_9PSEU|nr:glycine cleavage T C-terminal barrel domain-containing protein [Saccharopolyspora rectivirgula]KEI44548.1 glycine cleavage system protein T [Saccharopolyspora rectivirgula]
MINSAPGVLLYPRIRKSPYFYASRKHGVAMYSVYNHTYHPRHYGDPIAEYWALLEGVTLWDVGVERQVEITGPDAFEFTNMLVPRDLNKCKVGQCKYVFITNEDGGIINDPVLLRLDENHFWLSLADSDVLLWAKGLAYSLGMDVQIREADVGPVQIQGPKSLDVMVDLFGDSIREVPYYYAVHKEIEGMQVVVSRTGYTAELGYEIYLHEASKYGVKLWDLIWEAGKPHGMKVIGPCHIRRIEAGILSWGCDITYETNPFEVGYGFEKTWMVDLDQEADFIGKQALQRIKQQGISRKLVGVEIDGPSVGSFNDGSMIDVFDVHDPHGLRIGEVTSACYSPRLGRNIGYAMVPIAYQELGTQLVVDTQHGPQDAVVVEKPFLDPTKDIPKRVEQAPA